MADILELLCALYGITEEVVDSWDYDITFCGNKECPLRPKCGRNTDRLKDYPYPVSMCGFKPDENGNCEMFYPQKHKTNKMKRRKNAK